MIKMLVHNNIFKRTCWRELLKSGAEILKVEFPTYAKDIDNTVQKYTNKSPMETILTAEAYKWLRYLETNGPNTSDWYPRLAVDVAHDLFGLKGNISTFWGYLQHRSRKPKLKSIKFPEKGVS